MSNKFHQLKLKKMTHYAFQLPHLNCHIAAIDNVVHNVLVQDMPHPYGVYIENGEYWLINWDNEVNTMDFFDLMTNDMHTIASVSFTGTRPTRPR